MKLSTKGRYAMVALVDLAMVKDGEDFLVYDAKTGTRLYQQRLGDGSTGFVHGAADHAGVEHVTG